MIEQLLANKETVPYAMALAAIILAATVGFLLGQQDPLVMCADYIVKVEQAEALQREQSMELAECKSKRAGGAVLDCDNRIKGAVSQALKNHKDIVCDD